MDIAYIRTNSDLSVYRFDNSTGWDSYIRIQDGSIIPASPLPIFRCPLPFPLTPHPVQLIPQDIQSTFKIPSVVITTAEEFEDGNDREKTIHTYNKDLNPEYEFVFYSAEKRLEFIAVNFGADVVSAYATLIPGAFQADLFRYCYLYVNGGCYIDNKIILRKPFRDFIRPDDTCLICTDYDRKNSISRTSDNSESYLNAIICIVPQHPAMKAMVDACVDNILNKQQEFLDGIPYLGVKQILDVTGPTLFYNTVRDIIALDNIRFKHIILNHNESEYRNFQIVERDFPHSLIATKTYTTEPNPEHYSAYWNRMEIFNKIIVQLDHFIVLCNPKAELDLDMLIIAIDGSRIHIRYHNKEVQWNFRPYECAKIDIWTIYFIPE